MILGFHQSIRTFAGQLLWPRFRASRISHNTSGNVGNHIINLLRNGAMFLLPIVALVSGPAMATTEYNKAIGHVGAQGGNGYVTFSVAPTAGCNWGNVYLDITTDQGKACFSVLLTAYSSNRPISRIDYTKATDGTCTVDLVEM